MGMFSLFNSENQERRSTKSVIVNTIMVLLTSCFTITYTLIMPSFDGAGFGTAGLIYALRYIPIMVTAALGGAVPGMISVLIVFIHRSLAASSFSYMTFIYLMVVIVVDVISRRRWFNRTKKGIN